MISSVRGHRLRAALRSVVMGGRYARAMAILRQEPVVLTFDMAAGAFQITPVAARPPPVADPDNPDGLPVAPHGRDLRPLVGPDDDAPAAKPATGAAYDPIRRKLEGVRIERVAVDDGRAVTEGGKTCCRYASGCFSNSSQDGRLTTRAATPRSPSLAAAASAR